MSALYEMTWHTMECMSIIIFILLTSIIEFPVLFIYSGSDAVSSPSIVVQSSVGVHCGLSLCLHV